MTSKQKWLKHFTTKFPLQILPLISNNERFT